MGETFRIKRYGSHDQYATSKKNSVEYSKNASRKKKNPVKLLKNQYIGLMPGKYASWKKN